MRFDIRTLRLDSDIGIGVAIVRFPANKFPFYSKIPNKIRTICIWYAIILLFISHFIFYARNLRVSIKLTCVSMEHYCTFWYNHFIISHFLPSFPFSIFHFRLSQFVPTRQFLILYISTAVRRLRSWRWSAYIHIVSNRFFFKLFLIYLLLFSIYPLELLFNTHDRVWQHACELRRTISGVSST